MKTTKISHVFDILTNLYNLNIINPCKNERYLHHYFTEIIQKDYPICFEDISKCKLHPEWATSNLSRPKGGKYKKIEKKYEIDSLGTSGFIDFVLGDYNNPEIGVEFKLNFSWRFESIVFDYVKLMDLNNPLNAAISFSIIIREKNLSNKLKLEIINKTVFEYKNRLKERLDKNRIFLFWIVEIAYNNKKINSWYCDNMEGLFKEDIPKFAEIENRF